MQFKIIAAALASLAATSVMANPLPNVDAAQGAEIQARAEQAEQAKQGKQIFGPQFGNNGFNNWGGPQNNGLTAFGFGGGGVNIPNGFLNNNNGGCPPLQCFQCNGWNQGWGQGQCGWGQFQGCPCW